MSEDRSKPGRSETSADPRLAELIENVTNRIQAGESVEDAELLDAHPEFQDELAALLPTLRLLAQQDQRSDVSSEETLSADLHASGFLPASVIGEYRIIRELGRGGMGIVYEAQQVSLGRLVALKVLPHFGTIDNRSSKRFQNEARAAGQLDHQHIVRVHAVGFDRGVHYYAMQLVVGTDLQQVIRGLKQTALDGASRSTARRSTTRAASKTTTSDATDRDSSERGEALDTSDLFGLQDPHATPANQQYVKTFARLGIQAAEALHHAHEMGIVHRDIKPSNLLLDTEGNIRVTDFGLAQIQGEAGVSVTGDVVGTLRYMSPEQAYAKRVVVDHRTDIYSLGVTLYELLTLERAFEGTSRVSLLHKIAFEDPTPPRRINRKIPVELETIVTKAMSKSPDQRYQTALELADDLRRFVGNEPIRARPPGLLEYARKWSSRHKVVVASAAIISAVLFVAAFVSSGVTWLAWQQTAAAFQSAETGRKEASRLWRKAEGLRLAARSALARPSNPGLAYALAVEGHKLYPGRDLNNALLAAHEVNHEHRTLLGHQGPVGSVAFDKDGQKLITTVARTQFTHPPEPARIWNVATGDLLVELDSDGTSLTSAVFSPAGVRVLATSAPIAFQASDVDGTDAIHHPTIWDSVTGDKLQTLDDGFLLDAHPAAFDPTGQRAITPAVDNTARIWDVLEGSVVATLEGHTKRVIFAAFDSQGELATTVSEDQTVRVWRARSGESQLVLEDWSGPTGGPTFAAFSPDGTRLATESLQNGIQIWDLATGNQINAEPWRGARPRFTPDGSRLVFQRNLNTMIRRVSDGKVLHEMIGKFAALASDGTLVATQQGTAVIIWDVDSGVRLSDLIGHDMDILTATFAKSTKLLATTSFDHTARLWHARSGGDRLGFAASLHRDNTVVAENADATLVAIAPSPDFRTQVIDLDTGRAIVDVPGSAWHADVRGGRLLTTERDRAYVYDAETGEEVKRFESSNEHLFEAQLGHDGKHAMVVSKGGRAWLWRVETNNRTELNGHTGKVLEMALAPNSDFVATGSEDGTARLWDSRTGQQEMLLTHTHAVIHVDVNRQGNRVATVTSKNEAFVWDVTSGEQVAVLRPIDGLSFRRVVFSPAGDRIFGSTEDLGRGVLCWDAETGVAIGSISPIRGRVRIATNPLDSRIVIASSVDGAVLWDPAGEQHVLTNTATAFGSFATDRRVITVTSGLNQDPESLDLPQRKQFTTPKLQVWNANDGSLAREVSVPVGMVAWLGVVPGANRVIVSGQFFGASIFNAETLELAAEVRGHGAPLSFAGFAGDALVTASWDGTAAVWDARSGGLQRQLNAGQAITAAAIAPDSQSLVVGDASGNVFKWLLDVDEPRVPLKAHEDLVNVVRFNARATEQFATASLDQTVRVRSLSDDVVQSIESDEAVARQIRFSPDGKQWVFIPGRAKVIERQLPGTINFDFAAAQQPAQQRVLVYGDGLAPRSFDAKSTPLDAYFRADGQELVTVSARHVIVWDVATAAPLREIAIAGDAALSADMSADGRLLVTEHREHASLWDLETGSETMTISPSRPDVFMRETHFDSVGQQVLTIVGQQLRSYPVRMRTLIEQSPPPLSPPEQLLFDILDEEDWPKE